MANFVEKFTTEELLHDLKTDPKSLVNHKLRRIWNTMNRRCYNPKDPKYAHYGAKGIEVCDEWRYDYFAYARWMIIGGYIPRIGSANQQTLVCDRIDPLKNYTPNNCRVISLGENSQIASKPKRVFLYDALDGKYLGSYRNPIEACRVLGLNTAHVSECLTNDTNNNTDDGRQVHGGYMYSYSKMEEKTVPDIVKISGRDIILTNIDTGEEKIFTSNKEASSFVDSTTSNMAKVLRGKRNSVKGWKAKYRPMDELGEN